MWSPFSEVWDEHRLEWVGLCTIVKKRMRNRNTTLEQTIDQQVKPVHHADNTEKKEGIQPVKEIVNEPCEHPPGDDGRGVLDKKRKRVGETQPRKKARITKTIYEEERNDTNCQ